VSVLRSDPPSLRIPPGTGSLNMVEQFEQEFIPLKEKVRELQEYL
jgi:hypothetical protein